MLTRRELFAVALTTLFSPCIGPARALAAETLRIGILPVLSPRASLEVFQPLVDYLGKGAPQRPELHTTPDFQGLYERIRAGQFDLALVPPHMARLAQVDLGWHLLALCGPEHHALLMARDGTGPTRPEELRGGSIAVLDRSALVALMVLEALRQRGLQEGRDFSLLETRNYESSRLAVLQGHAQAFVSRSRGFFEPQQRESFNILLDAGALPGYGFIAAPRLPPITRYRLGQELLTFAASAQGSAMLAKLGYKTLETGRDDSLRHLDSYLGRFRDCLSGTAG
jgi:phosphonate transport system substrate-binding protein